VSRIILGTSAAVFSTLELGILANKLGHLRWFWPYDDAVFSAGIIGGVVGALSSMGLWLQSGKNTWRNSIVKKI